jgi:hypothetical protein
VGEFADNEFAGLPEEDLHFLRIFVQCEGRIREMESAMGVSYPTIKARMAQLKAVLAQKSAPSAPHAETRGEPQAAILGDLQAGRITFEQAREKLTQLPKGKRP